ncbi:prepilin-type N-terminal cleavage/methylation domain-containing protein [Luteimonas sp. A277]
MPYQRIPKINLSRLAHRERGATLIELMIALLLGLVVVAAASGLFLTNKRVYASTETLNRIQENTRAAFEIMARDIREAGGNPCGIRSRPVSQLVSGETGWWPDYFSGLHGYGPGAASPAGTAIAAGTDALDLHLAGGGEIYVTDHSNPGADLDVTDVGDIANDDLLMVCNEEFSLVFQATNVMSSSLKIVHGSGSSQNCTQRFRTEYDCSNGNSPHDYCMYVPPGGNPAACNGRYSSNPARIVRIQSYRWYVAENGRGGDSLYRATLLHDPAGGTPSIETTAEIAEGISNLSLAYRSTGSTAWQLASGVTDWSRVNAVRVQFTATGTDGAVRGGYLEGTDGDVLSRTTAHVVALRNREGVL